MSTKETKQLSEVVDHALLGEAFKRKNRGRSGTLARPGDKATVIDCLGLDALAGQVTITCEAIPSEPLPDVFVPGFPPTHTRVTPALRGVLEWGNDGTEVSAEIDFVNGTAISLAAASVRLNVQLDEGVDVEDAAFVPPLVRAHIGYLTKSSLPAQRTRVIELAVDETGQVSIPPFAKRVRITNEDPAGAVLGSLVEFAPLNTCAAFSAAGPVIDMPIPNGARVLQLNNAGDNQTRLCAIFELWL